MSLITAPRTMGSRQVVTFLTGNDQVNQAIKEYCTNDLQKAVWLKPGIDIEAIANRIDPDKVKTRPGYLNAVLIQSRGRTGMVCTQCARDPTRGPFLECKRLKGHFGGCCGNCKWRDHAARCSVALPGETEDPEPRMIEGSQDNPIELD